MNRNLASLLPGKHRGRGTVWRPVAQYWSMDSGSWDLSGCRRWRRRGMALLWLYAGNWAGRGVEASYGRAEVMYGSYGAGSRNRLLCGGRMPACVWEWFCAGICIRKCADSFKMKRFCRKRTAAWLLTCMTWKSYNSVKCADTGQW